VDSVRAGAISLGVPEGNGLLLQIGYNIILSNLPLKLGSYPFASNSKGFSCSCCMRTTTYPGKVAEAISLLAEPFRLNLSAKSAISAKRSLRPSA
jgi:hypothetical protein